MAFYLGLTVPISPQKVVRSSTSTRVPNPTLEDCALAEILTGKKKKKPQKRKKTLPHFHSFQLEEDQKVTSFSANAAPTAWLD